MMSKFIVVNESELYELPGYTTEYEYKALDKARERASRSASPYYILKVIKKLVRSDDVVETDYE
jgi:hypothetical protein